MKQCTRLRFSVVTALTLMIAMSVVNEVSFLPNLLPSVDALVRPMARSHVVWQPTSFRLLNSHQDGEEGSILESSAMLRGASTTTTANITFSQSLLSTPTTTTTTTAQFGDVVPLQRKASFSPSFLVDNANDLSKVTATSSTATTTTTSTTMVMNADDIKRRNIGVALVSIALAVMNYLWEYLHPLQPIQLLYQMEQQSAPITVIGTTNKPTVVDFWAPWCENCKLLAPTLVQIEEEFGKDVNFVMINGDEASAWPMIEAFGVDAIPHLALVEADGTVDTALIGPIPKQWLEKDLQVLVDNAKLLNSDIYQQPLRTTTTEGPEEAEPGNTRQLLRPLPYQMLDVFANRPSERRIQVLPQQDITSNSP